MSNVSKAIRRSAGFHEVVTLPWVEADFDALYAACDDSVRATVGLHEFWGTTDEGAEWRVHMKGCPPPRPWKSGTESGKCNLCHEWLDERGDCPQADQHETLTPFPTSTVEPKE